MASEPRDRMFSFTLTRSAESESGDGLDFEGYAAVFNTPARIEERDGSEFDEVFAPGAFKQTINRGNPVFMFQHGKHPLLGAMPLGRITELREDPNGLYVKARMTDNWLIAPVRDAIADGAVTGMSVRMEVVKDAWSGRPSRTCRFGELRTIREAKVIELGPCIMPAYAETTASVRSAFRDLETAVEGITVNVSARDTDTISTEAPTILQQVKQAINDRLGLDGPDDVYTIDFYEDSNRLVFTVSGRETSEHSALFQADYTYADGVVTLSGDPVAVQAVSYEPRSLETESSPTETTSVDTDGPAIEDRDEGSSTEAAPSSSTEAAATETRAQRGPMTTPAERDAYLREVELRRRGIRIGA